MGNYQFVATAAAGLLAGSGVVNVNVSQSTLVEFSLLYEPSPTPTYVNVTVRCTQDLANATVFETTVSRIEARCT
jgi:hypothetical protein